MAYTLSVFCPEDKGGKVQVQDKALVRGRVWPEDKVQAQDRMGILL
jgi:hypothetical protein